MTSKVKAEKTFFNSNKCKHVELNPNLETEKFENHLMIESRVINPGAQPSEQ